MAVAATIGCFDGAHRGHLRLLQQLHALAAPRGMHTMALTFSCHPSEVLGRTPPPQLCTLEDKQQWLSAGVESVEVLPFTRALAALTAKDFMQHLRDQYDVRLLLIGYDHHFGRPQPTDDYERDGRALGIEICRALPLQADAATGITISSSAIRQALREGRVEAAWQMLGRPYQIVGEVVRGFQVGRTIGFPTANIATGLLVPASGVYAVEVHLPAEAGCAPRVMPGVLNVGTRPTIGNGAEPSVEVHIPGYQGDLYGQQLRVEILRKLRDERKFESLEALKAQIAEDIRGIMN